MEKYTIERNVRDMEDVADRQKRFALFSRFLMNSDIVLDDPKKGHFRGKIVGFSDDCTNFSASVAGGMFIKGTKLTLNKFVGRYIRIECTVNSVQPNSVFLLEINTLRMAKKNRAGTRINPPKDMVYANNFRLTRPNADMDEFSVPTFVKITFSDYQNKLSGKFDHIEIDTFRPGLPEKFYLVKSTGKSIYIRDTQDLKSYKSADEEEFLDCTEEFLDDLTDVMKDYRNKKIAAEIIMPVIYLNSTNQAIPIGYVLIQSYTKKIEFDDLMEAKILCFDMIERIRESNTLVYSLKAEIINLSQDGLRIKVTDPELKNQIPVIHGFTMDIVFKMQSPVNVIVLVRNTIRDDNGDIQVGLEIEGFRKGDKERYLDNYSNLARPARS